MIYSILNNGFKFDFAIANLFLDVIPCLNYLSFLVLIKVNSFNDIKDILLTFSEF